MKKQYTIDRIEDKKIAVLLDSENESLKLEIPIKDIPVKVKEGYIINMDFDGNKIIHAEVDKEATEKARREVQKILDDLKNKGSEELKW